MPLFPASYSPHSPPGFYVVPDGGNAQRQRANRFDHPPQYLHAFDPRGLPQPGDEHTDNILLRWRSSPPHSLYSNISDLESWEYSDSPPPSYEVAMGIITQPATADTGGATGRREQHQAVAQHPHFDPAVRAITPERSNNSGGSPHVPFQLNQDPSRSVAPASPAAHVHLQQSYAARDHSHRASHTRHHAPVPLLTDGNGAQFLAFAETVIRPSPTNDPDPRMLLQFVHRHADPAVWTVHERRLARLPTQTAVRRYILDHMGGPHAQPLLLAVLNSPAVVIFVLLTIATLVSRL